MGPDYATGRAPMRHPAAAHHMAQPHQQAAMPPRQSSRGQPQFRVLASIPAGTRVVSKCNPNIEYQPHDGPKGFGIYEESEEGPHIIEFRPVGGGNIGPPTAGYPQASSPASRDHYGMSQRPPPPFRFGVPPPRPPSAPPDHIDPHWVQWWERTANEDHSKLVPWYKKEVLEDQVLPMLGYISRIKGPHAEMYKRDLERRAEGLGYGKQEGEQRDEAWFSGQRGMVRKEHNKAVSFSDGITDWRRYR